MLRLEGGHLDSQSLTLALQAVQCLHHIDVMQPSRNDGTVRTSSCCRCSFLYTASSCSMVVMCACAALTASPAAARRWSLCARRLVNASRSLVNSSCWMWSGAMQQGSCVALQAHLLCLVLLQLLGGNGNLPLEACHEEDT